MGELIARESQITSLTPSGVPQAGSHNQLRDLHALVYVEFFSPVVNENDAHLASVAFVDRTRSVKYSYRVSQGKPTSRSDLGFCALWKFYCDSGPDQFGFSRFQRGGRRRIEI